MPYTYMHVLRRLVVALCYIVVLLLCARYIQHTVQLTKHTAVITTGVTTASTLCYLRVRNLLFVCVHSKAENCSTVMQWLLCTLVVLEVAAAAS
jgi:hypothetical protein